MTAGRRSRVSAPVVAAWSLAALIIVLFVADGPLGYATRWAGTGFGENLASSIAVLPIALLGFVVARRQPGNPLGWMFLALVGLLTLSGVAADYAWLSYRLGHHLPLAAVGVVLAPAWCLLLVTLPLMILLFPDGLLATQVLRFHSTVAVAAATLAAAALFNPLRRRVQRIVARRFNRARYDADQMVAAFAARLKDAVDLDSVRDDLAGVVQQALEPAHVSVWFSRHA